MEDVQVIDKRMKEESLPAVQDNSPASMMMTALARGGDLEKLEKFMELQERWEAREAKKAYTEAMAAFKADPPEIFKDRKVSYSAGGKITEYRHASLWEVTKKINSALGEHGLSAAWETKQDNGNITVTCTITHKQGHSESTSLTAAPDTSGAKNSIQAIGSTISYLERYTVLALTGLATADMDDDGQSSEIVYITEEQLHELRDQMLILGVQEDKFCEYLKVETLEKLPADRLKLATVALDQKRKALNKKEDKA